jgi:DNA-binding NarL/FixJ family response regulator
MKILIVDDHAMFLDGVKFILQSLGPDISILQESNFDAALTHIASANDYDLILMDMNLGNEDGALLLARFVSEGVLTPVVMVSATEDIAHIQRALDSGASGFIPKSYGGERLLSALRAVLSGTPYISTDVVAELEALQQKKAEFLGALTTKQIKVISLLCSGLSNKDIADKMFLTENTIKSHLMTIFQKLGVKSRTECVLKAQKYLV